MNKKLSKSVIKSIVKECLVEILAEGIVSPSKKNAKSKHKKLNEALVNQSRQVATRNSGTSDYNNQNPSLQTQGSYLDNISYNNKQMTNASESKINNVVNRATSLTTDPIMSGILADTAKTTLQEQLSAESNRGQMPASKGDTAARIASQSDPTDLFSGSSKNWANLAFGSGKS